MSYYVTHENSVLNINNAHLKVSGNVMTDVMKLGAIEFAPPSSDVPGTVNFTNVTTGVTTTSNLNVGGTLMIGSVEVVGTPANAANLHDVVELGNVTSNTVQFTNATTGIVATGNVETQGKFIGDGSLLTGITTIESNVDLVRNTNNTAFINLNSNVVTEFPRSKKLIKYPRVVLTANGSNQGYTVSGSNDYSAGLTYYGAFTPPTSSDNPSGAWLTPTSGTTGYSTSTGEYLLSAQLHSASLTGEYVQIVLPERINPVYFTVQPRPESAYNNQGLLSCINEGEIWASDDSGTTWTPVGTIQNFTPTGLYQEYIVNNFNVPGYYDTFALIIHKNNGQTFAGVGEWKIFGTPEYDPEAHGTDVVVKSVPNVPNTDWLEVYYDAKGLENGSTTVNDLKPVGTANNGTVGGNTSVTDEAFTFDGTGDYITSTVTTGTGNQSFSVACWFKFTTLGGLLWGFTGITNGTSGSNPTNNSTPHSYFNTTGSITFDFWANSVVTADKLIEANRWYAGVWTYDGTTRKIYIDGTQVHLPQSSTPLSIINSTSRLSIGIYPTNLLGGPMSGSVANFRLFNRALTSDEVWQLYAYQKEYFGHGDLSMTLKAGRLGIGTSEPRAMLDVRGDVAGRFTRFLTYDHVVHSSTTFNSGPSWPIGQSLSLVSHTWDIPTEYAALGRGTLNGYAYVSWSGSCPNPWQAVFWIDIYYNGVYMGRGSTNSDVGNTSANHGNTTVALTHHDEDNHSTLDSANVTTGFRLPDCNLSRGSTITIDLICQRGDYQSGENVVWTNRNHTAPSSNARDYEQGTTNFFVLLNVE